MKRFKHIDLLLMTAWVAVSCSEDAPAGYEPVTDAIDFSCSLRTSGLQSRAGDDDVDVWLDMPFDTWKWNDTPIKFFIHQQVSEGTPSNFAVYQLKQGEIGRLECVSETPLNWVSNKATHSFRAWTAPAGVKMSADNKSGHVFMTENNLDYEYFVGAEGGPVTYEKQGLTMGLRFEHLISKIVIDKITIIYSDGSANSNIWKSIRSISFPNMPYHGTFITGAEENGEPMRVYPSNIPENHGITFKGPEYEQFINTPPASIPLYVLPQEFDDGNDYGKFFVALNHKDGDARLYEGNLKDLVNEYDEDNPLTGIKAGECLTVRLVLQDKEVKGYYVHIQGWDTAEPGAVSDAPYPAISSEYDIVNNASYVSGNTYKLNLDDFVYDEVDGKKIVRLCNSIDLSVFPGITLVIPEDYVLDGCGFDIICPGLTIEGETQNLTINGV